MGDKEDKWNNYLMVYEPFQNQNFKRRDLSWNGCKKYSNYHLGTYRTQNQYNYKRNRMREIKSYSKNVMDLDRKKMKNNMGNKSKKCHPWSDEAMEEERKRQLSDAANKLMSKLKMWNMEKNEKQEENGSSDVGSDNKGTESVNGEDERVKTLLCDDGEMNQKKEQHNNQKSRRLESLQGATQKKTVLVKCGFKNNSPRTVKNNKEKKQKKIQQSLIGELMTMPKQNWKYVLSDPKMHPKIERKMTQIVKENRLLLAQKFRFLAESKINSQGQCAYTKFVDDVGDLIDSDLAVDLCQLPPEVIKQISDIFQLNIENNSKETDTQVNDSSDKNMDNTKFGANCYGNIDDNIMSNECRQQESKNNEEFCVKTELQNISDPENSTDLKDSILNNSSVEIFPNTYSRICIKTEPVFSSGESYSNCSDGGSINGSYHAEMEESCQSLPEQNSRSEQCGTSVNDLMLPGSEFFNLRDKVSLKKEVTSEDEIDMPDNKFDSEQECNSQKSKDVHDFPSFNSTRNSIGVENVCSSEEKNETDIGRVKRRSFTTGDSDLKSPIKDSQFICHEDRRNVCATIPDYVQNGGVEERHCTETQTEISVVESDHSETFLGEQGFEDREALLKEVQMIDDLVHRLNRRRYVIFLKLVGLKSLDTSEHFLKTSLVEAVTNGDTELLKELSDKSTVEECSGGVAWYSQKNNSGRTKRSDSVKRGPKRRPQTKDLYSVNRRTRDWRSCKGVRSSSNFEDDGSNTEKWVKGVFSRTEVNIKKEMPD